MILKRIVRARSLGTAAITSRRTGFVQTRCITQADLKDPNMNGGYIQPPAIKRQFRDPYGDWSDKQERRNYGEPVHEDNDILGLFSPYEYTHIRPGPAFLQLLTFVGAVLGLCGVVALYYPDKPSAPREFEGGLDRELGGVGVNRLPAPGDG